ncbi:hypothetical protein L5G28_07625 [Gordonia sp. HY285]|uniref:hypothetical protein n=1 Tax=Gordonia liuliyuniae TaxID=2911517 RepID=UPI001F3EF8DA|nr:hypothetical protein [Gordonia liuliyuniae]MCF8610030.1 hypothetical protein [Gordonia liuliyuniae]
MIRIREDSTLPDPHRRVHYPPGTHAYEYQDPDGNDLGRETITGTTITQEKAHPR